MKARIFRKSNEGFKNYKQHHITHIDIEGCHCFVDKIIDSCLIYSNEYTKTAQKLGLKNRTHDSLNSIEINEDTIVYARNIKIKEFKYDEYGVDFIRGKIDLKYPDNYFIPIKLKDVLVRLDEFKKHEYTCKQCDIGMSGIYDWEFYEIILDINKIIKG